VEFPDGRIIDWDIVGQPGKGPHFATVFPYFTKSKLVRVLKEYSQGTNEMKYTMVAGGFDIKKHSSILDTAKDEMNEEASLKNGRFIQLLGEENEGIAELKWSRNRFMPFLCIDPEDDLDPKAKDLEELIEVEDISIAHFMELVLKGEMLLPAVQTGLMAIDWLKSNGFE
jgi:hypothetical protein